MSVRVLGTFCSNANISWKSVSCDHSGNRFLRKQTCFVCVCAGEREHGFIVLPLSLPLVSSASLIAAAAHIHARHSDQPIRLSPARMWLTGSTVAGPPTLPASSPFGSSWLPVSPSPSCSLYILSDTPPHFSLNGSFYFMKYMYFFIYIWWSISHNINKKKKQEILKYIINDSLSSHLT